MSDWSSLEVVKLVVGTLTPVSVAYFGWLLNRRVKKLEQAQWANQKLIEKRLGLYDGISPLLNKLLCFYTWVGYWKDVSPKDVVEAKRSLDKTINIYRYLLGERFYQEYQSFIHMLFDTYSGAGSDPLIRSQIVSPSGDRIRDRNYEWDTRWDGSFTAEDRVVETQQVRAQYEQLMNIFKDSLGMTQ